MLKLAAFFLHAGVKLNSIALELTRSGPAAALYPDLVLVLTLQASLAPLDIVQADRFLAQYAEDPTLQPDPDGVSVCHPARSGRSIIVRLA